MTNSTSERQIPTHLICIAPEEHSLVVAYLKDPELDANRVGQLHLHLCAACKELVEATQDRFIGKLRQIATDTPSEEGYEQDDHKDVATSMRDLCVSEILVMKAEHIAREDLPLGRKIFDEITNRLQSLTLEQEQGGNDMCVCGKFRKNHHAGDFCYAASGDPDRFQLRSKSK